MKRTKYVYIVLWGDDDISNSWGVHAVFASRHDADLRAHVMNNSALRRNGHRLFRVTEEEIIKHVAP